MYLTISPRTHRDEWVYFILTDQGGAVIDAGICRYVDLTGLPDIDLTDKPDGDLFLTPVMKDADRLKLANNAMADLARRGAGQLQWKIRDIVASWAHGNRNHGHPVMCVDTNEQWRSISDCATAIGASYSQLLKHLNGTVGYKTVKGKKYKRI